MNAGRYPVGTTHLDGETGRLEVKAETDGLFIRQVGDDGYYIAELLIGQDMDEAANARRLAACWNYFADGVPTDAIEAANIEGNNILTTLTTQLSTTEEALRHEQDAHREMSAVAAERTAELLRAEEALRVTREALQAAHDVLEGHYCTLDANGICTLCGLESHAKRYALAESIRKDAGESAMTNHKE